MEDGDSSRTQFQSWNRHVKDSGGYLQGDTEGYSNYFDRLRARYDILGGMEATRKHINFYTHTNPYGCPWCELFVVAGLAIKAGRELANAYEEIGAEMEGNDTLK